MAIEGPLRELGIHDVFQLLDLSRKTGTLFVTSELRDNDGTVLFRRGRVASATIRSNPHRLGDMLLRSGKVTEGDVARSRAAQTERGDTRRMGEILLEIGAITPKELERQVRLQIEAVVFELMSWREGFFRFEEGPLPDDGPTMLEISTESLLMEGARRIDEWSRIADRVPSLTAVPHLAPVEGDDAPQLDLLPSEWEVLTMIDGTHDLRGIAANLVRSEFDVAKVVYGLVSTGVVVLTVPLTVTERMARQRTPAFAARPVPPVPQATEPPTPGQVDDLEQGFLALQRGDFDGMTRAWAQLLHTRPHHDMADRLRDGLEAASRLRSLLEAHHGD
jgi:hypothetical protein